MAPSLRSSNSAQNSPTTAPRSTNSNISSTSTTPSTTPTRKPPHCSTCKRPRIGHPRSGCPYDVSTNKDEQNVQNTNASHLTDALGSMVIASPVRMEREEDKKAFTRNRRRQSARPPVLGPSPSLLSLDTDSNDIVERLTQPGIFDDPKDSGKDAEGGKTTRIVRWQETILNTPTPNKAISKSRTPGRTLMPGTFIAPTPDSSFALSNSSVPDPKRESPSGISLSTEDPTFEDRADGSISSTSTRRRPQPLARTMSAVERDIFVSRLSDEAAATIYIVPKEEIEAISQEAAALKFIVHQVMNNDDNDSQALIILGRDEGSVQALLRKVENENRKAQSSKAPETPQKGRQGPSTLKTAAGAAVVGAVGAWAGLAFS